VAQRPQDPLRDGGHLVVDERWHLDDGVPVVAVREVLRAKEDTFVLASVRGSSLRGRLASHHETYQLRIGQSEDIPACLDLDFCGDQVGTLTCGPWIVDFRTWWTPSQILKPKKVTSSLHIASVPGLAPPADRRSAGWLTATLTPPRSRVRNQRISTYVPSPGGVVIQ